MKTFFNKAWSELKHIYEAGSICSERHMQCELFKLLANNHEFNNEYQIFVEPRITLTNVVIPDFVIISKTTKKIVAVVELKYVPHSYSVSSKDINTLFGFLSVFRNDKNRAFKLLTNPKTGDWSNIEFCFSKELLLIYCVITKVDADVITNHKELWKCDDDSQHDEINYLQYVGAVAEVNEGIWKNIID